jgi:hypothetical protein
MRKLTIFFIFTILMIISIQNVSFGEESTEEEDRAKEAKEAYKTLKRTPPALEEEAKEEKTQDEEVKKIPSKLKKLLPTEEKLEENTLRTIWKYVDKQSNFEEEGNIETMTALLRDISRVYDPIVNKYKVATIEIKIIKYDDIYDLEYYWEEISSHSIEYIFNNAYLVGYPSENVDCMFNFSGKGAVTICITNEYLVQSVIYDEYQEHFAYNQLKTGFKKLEINKDEMTINIVQDILKNIEKNEDIKSDYQLYKILESNKEIRDKEIEAEENMEKTVQENSVRSEQNKNKSLGIEKDKKYGIQNFSCIKDEFGVVTISGQFNNNQIKKDKLVVEILFLNNEQDVVLKNTAKLLDIGEFETKRFLGNTKIDQAFLTCTIQVVN